MMDSQPHIRFSETPPGSPKSCLKGARKLTFEDSGAQTEAPPTRSPRKSAKVSIRSPGDNVTLSKVVVNVIPPVQNPPDIQFSQHFDQSTPPPNCTSNGSYDFVEPKSNEVSEPCNDPQLIEVASKFVNEIIETAKMEAANREKPEQSGSGKPNLTALARDLFTSGPRGGWYRRAQGTISKWITNLCVRAQNSIRT